MPYVVTRSCCADASCVLACPVNCIHPAPGEPGFAEAEMLFVDPRACVDCGACVTACPVDALKPHTKLTAAEQPYLDLNAAYYEEHPHASRTPLALVPRPRRRPADGLHVAVVGAGPAGLFAADELLRHPGVRVTVHDRLPTPYGLARAGVAPDHQDTRQVTRLFRAIESQPGFAYRLDTEVGRNLRHEDLVRDHHAVIYAVGAATDRRLGIDGEDLPGSVSATDFVAWYNGHPDHSSAVHDLSGERAVVVGNGNVALDVARVLTADPAGLARTEVSDRALAALWGSRIREVVVLGRRGPAEAAFTLPELLALAALDGIDVLVEGLPQDAVPHPAARKAAVLAELAARTPVAGRRRIVLRFLTAPTRILGDDRVTGLEVARTELRADADGRVTAVPTAEREVLETGLVLRAVGYRGRPVPGLPFDEATGTVPHERGRVAPGVYVAGWIKRGPTGFIGTNKTCAQESVTTLLDDFEAGLLTPPVGEPSPPAHDGARNAAAGRSRGRSRGAPGRRRTRGMEGRRRGRAGGRRPAGAPTRQDHRQGGPPRHRPLGADGPRRGSAGAGPAAPTVAPVARGPSPGPLPTPPLTPRPPTGGPASRTYPAGMAETSNRGAGAADGRSTRWNEHRARRQSELVDAAVAAVEEDGPGIGVKQIADRLGLPRSVVYRHFKDRADLDELIRGRIVDSLMADLAPTLEPDGTVVEAVRRTVEVYLDWIRRHPRLHAFLGAGAPAAGAGVVAGTKAAIAVKVGELFAAVLGALGRDPAPARSIAFGIVGFVDATVNHWLSDQRHELTGSELADLLTCSIWSVLDGNLRALGIELAPDRPLSDLLGDGATAFQAMPGK
ncbi:FAD-dependent oxidoreductase [Streptomyces sp. NPDC053431]|uniref:FAD-dependent oxidoreductase n=1 Tax=Streptomyces sp. NPDC053431 TaxID=3365703 RepID=UPI0037D2FB13